MEKEKLGTLPYVISGLSFIPLIGIGADNQPYTADDLLPKIDVNSSGNVGFRVKG